MNASTMKQALDSAEMYHLRDLNGVLSARCFDYAAEVDALIAERDVLRSLDIKQSMSLTALRTENAELRTQLGDLQALNNTLSAELSAIESCA